MGQRKGGVLYLRCSREDLLMWHLLQFYWLASRGYRFRPWDSPYIQWRFETFLGHEAANLNAAKFWQLSWKYRHRLKSFSDWAALRRRAQGSDS
jgi:hypothetical protein